MKVTTFQITYILTLPKGTETHITRVKNCESILHAKIKLKAYLDKKYPDLINVEMTECNEDFFNQLFGL